MISFWSFPVSFAWWCAFLASVSYATFQLEQREECSISYCLKHIASQFCVQDLHILNVGVSAFHLSSSGETHADTHSRIHTKKYHTKWLDVNQSGIKHMEGCNRAPKTGNGFMPPPVLPLLRTDTQWYTVHALLIISSLSTKSSQLYIFLRQESYQICD